MSLFRHASACLLVALPIVAQSRSFAAFSVKPTRSFGAWIRSASSPTATKTSGAARMSARSASGPLPPCPTILANTLLKPGEAPRYNHLASGTVGRESIVRGAKNPDLCRKFRHRPRESQPRLPR